MASAVSFDDFPIECSLIGVIADPRTIYSPSNNRLSRSQTQLCVRGQQQTIVILPLAAHCLGLMTRFVFESTHSARHRPVHYDGTE